MAELVQLQKAADTGLDKRVALQVILFTGDTPTQTVTLDYLKTYLTNTKVRFPSVIDPQRTIYNSADMASLPLHMLIDLSTMKIVWSKAGGALSDLYAAIQTYLK